MKHIGIDARMLGPHTGGIGRYTQQLVLELLGQEGSDTYTLFLRSDNWDVIPDHPRVKKVLADIQWYSLKEQLFFSSLIKKEHLDLMHFPHWNVPFLYRGPFVVTIHDLIMFHYPRPDATTLGPLVYKIKDLAHRLVIKRAAKKARAIMVPTQWVKQDVVTTLGVNTDHIHVTYEAPLAPLPPEQRDKEIFLKKDITQPYALYVGSGYPHENLDRLIEAWQIARDQYEMNGQLVFVGKMNPSYRTFAKRHQEHPDIIFTDFVSDRELAALYGSARAFLFPSLSEGFGLPPLEAMTYGVPVLSSSASCMPEVYGEAALYVDPFDSEMMASQIRTCMEDEEVRSELIYRAREELKRYSWKMMSAQTDQIYTESIK